MTMDDMEAAGDSQDRVVRAERIFLECSVEAAERTDIARMVAE